MAWLYGDRAPGRIRAYLFACACVLAAALLRVALPGVLAGTPYLAFYPAMVAAAAFGGAGAGLLATAGSVLCICFAPPHFALEAWGAVAMVRTLLFLAGGAGVSLVAGMLQGALARQHLQAAALEAAANGIAITDASGAIVWVNRAFEQLTGYSRQEALGQNPRILKSGQHDERVYRHLWDTITKGQIWRGELVNRRKDGRLYTEQMAISPLRSPQGEIIHFIAVKQDISRQKAQAQALAAAKVSAEQANSAKDAFLAVLSHELRTPLTPVVATAALLQENPHLDPESREQLEVIRRNVELEVRLIDDLLDVTRIVRGEVQLDRQPVLLGNIVKRAAEVCQTDIEARQLTLVIDSRGGPYRVHADAARLQQVVWNLLKNAIKFTPRGGRIVLCVRRDADSGGAGAVMVEVSDNGMGIDAQTLPRLFQPFEQGGVNNTRQFGGLGLGLSICKAMVELHGGTIAAHSEGKGRGASFRIRLPLLETPAAATGDTPSSEPTPPNCDLPAPAIATAHVRRLRILLVEDHPDTARIMQHLLAHQGHEVEAAGNVALALSRVDEREPFDLLISDLGLPDGTGHDLMRTLRQRGCQFPGIVLSGYGQQQDIQRSREAGFAAHLTKPVSPGQLRAAIIAAAGC